MKKINIQQKEDKESYEVGSVMFLNLKFKLLCIFISYFSEVFTQLSFYSRHKARMPLTYKRAAFQTERVDDLWQNWKDSTVQSRKSNIEGVIA